MLTFRALYVVDFYFLRFIAPGVLYVFSDWVTKIIPVSSYCLPLVYKKTPLNTSFHFSFLILEGENQHRRLK